MHHNLNAHSGTSRKDRKNDRRRREILRSASEAFRRYGFDATTTRQIAEGIGMTPGSLYYYFRNKHEIISYCQQTALDQLLSASRRIARSVESPEAKLYRLICEQIRCLLVDLHGSLAHIEFDGLPGAHRSEILAKRKGYEAIVRKFLRDGMRRRHFRRGDPKLLALAILGAVNWSVKWYSPSGPAAPAEIGRSFASYLVGGLLRKGVRPRFPRDLNWQEHEE